MTSDVERRPYGTLDGLRGMAAILVVGRHVGALGHELGPTYLAVDLFFFLSGFVISLAYDQRLAAGGAVGAFVRMRLIRLYPLYALGLALGLIAFLLNARQWPGPSLFSGMLMLPDNPITKSGASDLNNPVWTLPLELLVNMIYAALFVFLSTRTIFLLVCISACGIVWSIATYGTIDVGWSWGQLPAGLARLFFSFFGGVLLCRLRPSMRTFCSLTALALVVVAACLLAIPLPAKTLTYYDGFMVLVAIPVIVVLAIRTEPVGKTAAVLRFLGLISYAVYVLHYPLGRLAILSIDGLGYDSNDASQITQSVFLLGVLACAALASHFYDGPARKYLSARFIKRKRRPDASEFVCGRSALSTALRSNEHY